ncbi:MAG: dipeptide epimerase [Acidobacteriota bacterium]
MKIVRYEASCVDLPLLEGYRIAGRTITFVRNFLLRLQADSGLVGHGSAAPAQEVTGESEQACLAALRGPLRDLTMGTATVETPPRLMDPARAAAPGCPAACAALDIALWDLAAQRAGVPLVRLWGGVPRALPTSVTIGVCSLEETLEAARRWLQQGFRILKVKVGEDVEADIERLVRLREQCGAQVSLRADANQGYTLEQARALLRGTEAIDLQMLEQPLQASDLDGLGTLRRESRVPILADESVCSIEQAEAIADGRLAHGINIKLMKCGGPSPARVIHDRAHAAGLSLMLGCNDESRISIAAAAHLAMALPGVAYADLDGHLDLASDPATGGIDLADGCLRVSERPGLGIEVKN